MVAVPATNGVTARRNLDAQVEGARKPMDAEKPSLSQRRRYVDLLLTRTRFGGTYQDFDTAVAVADKAVADYPKRGEAHALRATVRSALHRWDEALADLERAAELGEDVTEKREGIELARGQRVEAIVAARKARVAELATYDRWVGLALAQSFAGDFEAADESYVKSMGYLKKGSPFPAAWTYFHRGVMWSEMAERPDLGCAFYREALRYVPSYVVATTHLSELELDGERPRAIRRLRGIIPKSTDPEPKGFLGEILVSEESSRAEGEKLIAEARARYEELLGNHRLAFADHGAEFFMGPGADPARALKLALENLANRKTGRAYAVAIEAAQAAKQPGEVCRLAAEAKTADSPNRGLRALLDEVVPACR